MSVEVRDLGRGALLAQLRGLARAQGGDHAYLLLVPRPPEGGPGYSFGELVCPRGDRWVSGRVARKVGRRAESRNSEMRRRADSDGRASVGGRNEREGVGAGVQAERMPSGAVSRRGGGFGAWRVV